MVDESIWDVVALWNLYRGGAGHLPDTGGVNDQACWLLEAFAIMDVAAHQIKKGMADA